MNTSAKASTLSLCFLVFCGQGVFAQAQKASPSTTNNSQSEQEVINLYKKKWGWMAEKKVDSLAALFDEKVVFMHMGGTMSRDQELNVIKTSGIHYKQTDIQETSVKFIGNTAILLNKIRLLAVVGGNEPGRRAFTNPFVVIEVYVKEGGIWALGSMSFTRLLSQ